MNKEAILKETYNSSFYDELEKIGVSIDSLEYNLDDYLTDKQEAVARELIEKAKEKSFILRHPILTGIATLGIAPTIANSLATDKIIGSLARSDSTIRDMVRAKKMKEHELDVAYAGATKINNELINNNERRYAK